MHTTTSNSNNLILELIENENMQDIEWILRGEATNDYVKLIDHKLSLTPVEWALLCHLVEAGISYLEQDFSCKKVEGIIDQIKKVNQLKDHILNKEEN